MTRIIVYNNFGDDQKMWIRRMSKQSPEGHRWKDIELVSDIKESDLIIVLDGIKYLSEEEKEHFSKKDKIFIQREPEQVQGNLRINPHDFIKTVTYENHHPYVDWWIDMNYTQLSNLKYNDVVKTKKNPICIISTKTKTDGQRKRLPFLTKIQHMTKIDFYGKPGLTRFFQNYIGPVEYETTSNRNMSLHRDKSRILEYELSISLENGKRKNFFTRTSEDLLCWALPIYWGCPNLDEFFPQHSYRYVNIEEDITQEQIEYLVRQPEREEIESLKEARNLILNKYNFFPFLEKVLKEI